MHKFIFLIMVLTVTSCTRTAQLEPVDYSKFLAKSLFQPDLIYTWWDCGHDIIKNLVITTTKGNEPGYVTATVTLTLNGIQHRAQGQVPPEGCGESFNANGIEFSRFDSCAAIQMTICDPDNPDKRFYTTFTLTEAFKTPKAKN